MAFEPDTNRGALLWCVVVGYHRVNLEKSDHARNESISLRRTLIVTHATDSVPKVCMYALHVMTRPF